jgi:NAD(P)-dependent dehydrogenase (short-subunit alcohol dehydrogenase family)
MLMRSRAIITGAAGGMGQACARAFGQTMDLVLTDLSSERLNSFAKSLQSEGYGVVACLAGDLADVNLCNAVVVEASGGNGLGTLVHTAAISQMMGSWNEILRVNLVGTVRLLNEIETILVDGSVAILIASMAGHLSPVIEEADDLLDNPLAPDFFARIEPLIASKAASDTRGASPLSYALSKRTLMRICEQRAASWARRGARIVSLSPGMIWTPMGQREADGNPFAAAVVEATPVGRWGAPNEIAAAARFLASDAAAFITGTDLRVDGGVTPVMRLRTAVRA